jgi:hypothetical protein
MNDSERREESGKRPSVKRQRESEAEMRRAKQEALSLIKRELWLGEEPPQPSGVRGRWSMAREISVWKQLAIEHGSEQVNGAITVARETLDLPTDRPITLLLFNQKGSRHYLNECIGAWRAKLLGHADMNAAGALLRSVLSGNKG